MERYFVGIDLGGTFVKAVLADSGFHIVAESRIPTPVGIPASEGIGQIIKEVEDLLAQKPGAKEGLMGIGIGLPGQVDTKAGVALWLPNVNWVDVDVKTPFEEHFGVPMAVGNDGNINLLGEKYFGKGKGYDDIVLITLGTGLGSGIMIDGKLLLGVADVATETGHMIIEKGGDPCPCGKRGCFEAYCSAPALIRSALKLADEYPDSVLWTYVDGKKEALTADLVSKGYEEGDPLAKRVFERFVDYLVVGISNLIHIFNPGIVLLAGGVANAGDILIVPTVQALEEYYMVDRMRCPVLRADLKEAGTLGACALVAGQIGYDIPA